MKVAIKRISSDPLGLLGLCLVTLMVVSALGASIFAPYDPVQLNIMERLQGPSAKHLLGTDQLGRDLFSRVLYGPGCFKGSIFINWIGSYCGNHFGVDCWLWSSMAR